MWKIHKSVFKNPCPWNVWVGLWKYTKVIVGLYHENYYKNFFYFFIFDIIKYFYSTLHNWCLWNLFLLSPCYIKKKATLNDKLYKLNYPTRETMTHIWSQIEYNKEVVVTIFYEIKSCKILKKARVVNKKCDI